MRKALIEILVMSLILLPAAAHAKTDMPDAGQIKMPGHTSDKSVNVLTGQKVRGNYRICSYSGLPQMEVPLGRPCPKEAQRLRIGKRIGP
jgi:hypothetical protein